MTLLIGASMTLMSVDKRNGYTHAHLMEVNDFATARMKAEGISDFTPEGQFVRIYLGGLPVLEVAKGSTQPSLWFYERF